MRTDDNRNPAAFTTDLARQAGLVLGTDYVDGTPFLLPSTLKTAKLLGDPVEITIRLINAVGYYTRQGNARWAYIAMPSFVWEALNEEQKRNVVGFHYAHEGGTAMWDLFPGYVR